EDLSEHAGDLAFGPDGTMYVTMAERLYAVDMETFEARLVGDTNADSPLGGLAFSREGRMLGLSLAGVVYEISLEDASIVTEIVDLPGEWHTDLASNQLPQLPVD